IEVLDHPAAGALRVLGVPVKLSQTPGSVRTPPPRLGEHTTSVLTTDLGLTPAAMEGLARDGVIGVQEPGDTAPQRPRRS
ncbi:MAG: CoA transferase, partial [Vicinamibacterales bacterium]|nr:CoA transferase [Vicinamibacterales bacterium]